jgi:hypothetical protein
VPPGGAYNLFLNAFDIGELAATPARTINRRATCTVRRREVGSKRVGRRGLGAQAVGSTGQLAGG